MSCDDNIVNFPAKPAEEAVPPEERARRLKVEVDRLASLPVLEWMLYLEETAKKHGISQTKLRQMITAAINRVEREKSAREKQIRQERAERERQIRQERIEHEKQERQSRAVREEAFAALRSLPRAEHESGLARLARRLGQDIAELRDEFTLYAGFEDEAEPASEVWPEPVDTGALLKQIIKQVRRYAVVSDDIAIAVALWVMFAWVHEIAVNSPMLVFTSADENTGKTTLAGVMRFLVPRPHSTVELTGPSLFRLIDHTRPTLFIDESDDLMKRKRELKYLINAGWTRGTKVMRTVQGVAHEFELLSPKVLAMMGLDLEATTASRTIICKMVPKLESEEVEFFRQTDDDDFRVLRQKLARWAADNMDALRDAKPEMPPGFVNRLAANWLLLFAIADRANYGKRARAAAVQLSRRVVEYRSEGKRALEAIRKILADREMVTSAEAVDFMVADEDGEWAEFRGRSPITKRQLAVLLAPYDIRPVVVHPRKRSTSSPRGYKRSQFEEVFARFLGPTSAHPHIRARKAPKNGHK
jgi:hypothetical protein